MKYYVLVFLLALGTVVRGQGVPSNDTDQIKKFRFDVTGGFYYQRQRGGDDNKTIDLPSYLAQRRPYEPALANLWGLNGNQVTDNPLNHGASFLRFHSWYEVVPGLEIYGSLEVNNAGFSWGPYNTFNTVILPRYYATYRKPLTRRRTGDTSGLIFYGKIGNYEDYRNYEGLMEYNVDIQAAEASLQYKKFSIAVTNITDLKASIGLNIDGIEDVKASFTGLRLDQRWSADINAGEQTLLGTSSSGETVDFLSLSGAVYRDRVRLYAEGGYRFTDQHFDPALSYGLLAGIKHTISLRRLDWNYRLEYRYYGGGFNYGFRNDTTTHYRHTDKDQGGNFIGDQVYPISYLNRPFSQWAVFTEYAGKNWVSGVSFFSQFKFGLGSRQRFHLLAETDFNWISAQGESTFFYPFYKVGIQSRVYKGAYAAITLTNKVMDLDNFYPTYYLLKHSIFQFELRRDINL